MPEKLSNNNQDYVTILLTDPRPPKKTTANAILKEINPLLAKDSYSSSSLWG